MNLDFGICGADFAVINLKKNNVFQLFKIEKIIYYLCEV
jgi:hypothetical protein